MDKGKVTALTLRDLSSVFDTIDHSILLGWLEDWVGATGRAHHWLRAVGLGWGYWEGSRLVEVLRDWQKSAGYAWWMSVPQGQSPVWSPPRLCSLSRLLFTIYTTPLSQVVSQYDSSHHFYADDSQLYVSFSSCNSVASLSSWKSCLDSVQLWMSGNKLKLNPDKTEFLLIGHEWQRTKYLAMFPVDLLGLQTASAKAARNLGVIFDTNFSFHSHVSAVCRSCRYCIRNLRHICCYLSFDSAKLLAHVLVSSCLYYCHSLLFSIKADKEIIRLQRIQNSLAHVVTKKLLGPTVFHYYTPSVGCQ